MLPSINGSASYHLETIRTTLARDSLSLIQLLLNPTLPPCSVLGLHKDETDTISALQEFTVQERRVTWKQKLQYGVMRVNMSTSTRYSGGTKSDQFCLGRYHRRGRASGQVGLESGSVELDKESL